MLAVGASEGKIRTQGKKDPWEHIVNILGSKDPYLRSQGRVYWEVLSRRVIIE